MAIGPFMLRWHDLDFFLPGNLLEEERNEGLKISQHNFSVFSFKIFTFATRLTV